MSNELRRVVERLAKTHEKMARSDTHHTIIGFDADEVDALAKAGRNWERVREVLDVFDAGEDVAFIVMRPDNVELRQVFSSMGCGLEPGPKFANGAVKYTVTRKV